MKRFLYAALCVILALSLAACSSAEYTVSFDAASAGTGIESQTVKSGKKLSAPAEPAKEGYNFIGWFQDAGLTKGFDVASDKVQGDMTLYAGWDKDTGDTPTDPGNDKDFSSLRTPGSQEDAYEYGAFFKPEKDGTSQPFVGDTMPYYEDGTYYIYYLKEAGDSYNHSAYLATTTDFVSYTEYDDSVLEANHDGGQDSWIGTGSVVKVDGKYYFFYTGHGNGAVLEYAEKIMVAVGTTPTAFEKLEGWEITPPAELGQKNDFRDPQGYVDPDTGNIILTVTAAQDGVARILKYTVSADLQNVHYDGVIFTNDEQKNGDFWNLECSDTFELGGKYYITYSAQDDTLWYAVSDTPYGPYGDPVRLDGKLFYAAKHVEDGEKCYMVGWARRSESPSSTTDVAAWAGNIAVQEVLQNPDGTLYLDPVDNVEESFSVRRELPCEGGTHAFVEAGSAYNYTDAFTCYESFMLTGEFTFTGTGSFGLSFDYNGRADKNKFITISPSDGLLKLQFNQGGTTITETAAPLQAGETYTFTYIQEGSVGIFYIDGVAALTVRLYGVSGKTISLFAENNAVLFTSLREYTRP